MFDLNRESLITIRQASRKLPGRTGKPIHVSAVYRWIQRGVRGVRLEARQVGGTTYTSMEALERFSDALTAQCGIERERPREANVASAHAELKCHGF